MYTKVSILNLRKRQVITLVNKEEILRCMYSLKTKKRCEVHWIKTQKQILYLIHIASSSKSSLIIKWAVSEREREREREREIIDNIILDIWYILIAFFFFFLIYSKYLFQIFSPQSKNVFQNIIYLYNRI